MSISEIPVVVEAETLKEKGSGEDCRKWHCKPGITRGVGGEVCLSNRPPDSLLAKLMELESNIAKINGFIGRLLKIIFDHWIKKNRKFGLWLGFLQMKIKNWMMKFEASAFCLVGFVWQLGMDLVVVAMLLLFSWKFYRKIPLPGSWQWVLLYSVLITGVSELVYFYTKDPVALIGAHIEVLLPAFLLTLRGGDVQILHLKCKI